MCRNAVLMPHAHRLGMSPVLQVTLFCMRQAKVGAGISNYRLNECLVDGAVNVTGY